MDEGGDGGVGEGKGGEVWSVTIILGAREPDVDVGSDDTLELMEVDGFNSSLVLRMNIT